MQRTAKLTITATILVMISMALGACSSGGGPESKDNTVAASVNGKNIMLAEVERAVSSQSDGKQAQLSPLEMAQARLQVLGSLIQREVLFERAEREKLLPTEDEITAIINQQKLQSGMTDDDFQKSLTAQSLTPDGLREEARKDIAIKKLLDKYNSKITVNDKEVEDFYNNNRQQFVSARGVALAVIIVDPVDNSGQGIAQNDAKNETEAKLKIDNIYQQLKGGADFASVARSKSEDPNSLVRGGDIGFFSEDQLKQAGFPQELIDQFMGSSLQIGSFTDPKTVNGKWYIFKLAEKRLQTENLTLESPGVRPQITQALSNQRQEILKAALVEVSMNEAKIVNNLANTMLSNPSNLGLRPASSGAVASPPPGTGSTPANAPAVTASPATAAASPKASASAKP